MNLHQLQQLEAENHMLKVELRTVERERDRLGGVLGESRVMLERTANALQLTLHDLEQARAQLEAVRDLTLRWRRAGFVGVAADAERALATGTH